MAVTTARVTADMLVVRRSDVMIVITGGCLRVRKTATLVQYPVFFQRTS